MAWRAVRENLQLRMSNNCSGTTSANKKKSKSYFLFC
tara:strand:+ start:1283 stop:1393 length:111 start_codon:yes stop_codon:yes gene_type:complete